MATTTIDKAPRQDLQRAFDHLKSMPPADHSLEAIVVAMRKLTDFYGDVEARPPLTGVTVTSVDAGGVPAKWLVPDGADTDSVIVYLHGGGWIAGGMDSHGPMMTTIAKAAGMALLFVEYRLTPENPYPAGLDDCEQAFTWATTNRPIGPGAPKHIFLGGDSAGGNFSAAVTYRLVEKSLKLPDGLMLISPMLDTTVNLDRPDRENDPVGSTAAMEIVDAVYTFGKVLASHPTVSPINIPDEALAKFPKTLVQVSGAEFFLWDAQRFTYRLGMAGARVTLSVWPDMPHVWHLFDSFLPEARKGGAEAAAFLRSIVEA